MVTNFRTLVVANPRSANGSLGRRWGQISATIEQSFGPLDLRLTSAPGEASSISRTALQQGYEMVVALGGDGTISEVVDGFFTPDGPVNDQAVLGVLPFGTGGDFRKTIKAPRQLRASTRCLAGQQTSSIDVGRMSYLDHQGAEQVRHFINIASFGIGGLVDQLVNNTTKALGGRVSFAVATARAMRRYRPQRALIRLDQQEQQEVTLHSVAVANGRYFGGGMFIAPQAKLDDGLFDVITLGPMSMADLLRHGHRIYKGTHLTLDQVSMARARRVEAVPANPGEAILLDVDGETPGRLPAVFEVLPGALRLKVHQGGSSQ